MPGELMRMRAKPPTISFIIPVRDDAGRLRRCLDRVIANHSRSDAVDIVVMDNGSTDGSGAVARHAGARVMTLAGVTVADLRNRGAALARGELLAFIDADHEIDPGWAACAVDTLRATGAAAAGAPYHAPADGTWVQRIYDRLRVRTPGRHDVRWLGSGNLVIRADAFASVGGFDAALETCEDVDLCTRLRAAGYRIVSDDRLRSVHLGDPPTLRALFLGELWRGRDNLRMSLRGPFAWRDLPSVVIPLLDLAALAIGVAGLVAAPIGGLPVAIAALATIAAVSGLRAARMIAGRRELTAANVVQSFIVASVFDLARALAIVRRTRHSTRRTAYAG